MAATTRIDIRVTSSVGGAITGLRAVQRQLGGLQRAMNSVGASNSGLQSAASTILKIGAAAPALVGATAGVSAFASALGAAGIAAGALAVAVAPQFTKASEAAEQYAKAQEEAAKGSGKAAEEMAEYNRLLAAMPQGTREFTKALVSLKDATKKWSDSMADSTMPMFTVGLKALQASLPALTPLVKAATNALAPFIASFREAAESGTIEKYTTQLATFAGPALSKVLEAVKNLAVGFANLFLAFGNETAVKASDGLVTLTERFRVWSQTVSDSEGFQAFVDLANKMWQVILQLIPVVIQIVAALLPLSGIFADLALKALTFLASLPPEAITAISVAVLGMAAALKTASAAQKAFNAVAAMNPYVMLAVLVAALIAVLISLGVWLYKNSTTFRNQVKPAVDMVKRALEKLKDTYEDNKDEIDTLIKWLTKLGGKLTSVALTQVANFVTAISGAIDIIADFVGDLEDAYDGCKDLSDVLKRTFKLTISLALPTNFWKVVDTVKDMGSKLFKSTRWVPGSRLPNRRQTYGLGAPAASALNTAQSAARNTMNVALTVEIDGQQLQGRITRTVTSAMQRDGARLMAGGWA